MMNLNTAFDMKKEEVASSLNKVLTRYALTPAELQDRYEVAIRVLIGVGRDITAIAGYYEARSRRGRGMIALPETP